MCAVMIATSILTTLPTNVSAQQVTEEWVAIYNGPGNYIDKGWDIALGPSGDVYVTGTSTSNEGGTDYATIAYDPSGNELWVARHNGPMNGMDVANDIVVDSLGNVYVTGGSSYGQPTWTDYVTIAYDPQGNELWVADYDGGIEKSDMAMAMTLGPYGNLFVTGWCTSVESNVTSWNYATVAYDPQGNELWSATYDGPGHADDIGKAIAVDAWGNVYVTGYSYDDSEWCNFATVKYSQERAPDLDLDPDTLNLKSKRGWITAYIEIYDGRDVRDIDVGTLLLNETIPAERWPTTIGDYDEDSVPDLMVKFNRSRVQEYIEGLNIPPGGAGTFGYHVTLTITGSFNDGTTFECSDTIRVLTIERMGVEPGPFSTINHGMMEGGQETVHLQMSFSSSSHCLEQVAKVVSKDYYRSAPLSLKMWRE